MEDLRALVSGFSLSRARLAAASGVSEAAVKKLTKKELSSALTTENDRLRSCLRHHAGS